MRNRPLLGFCAAYAAGVLLAWSAAWFLWVLALLCVLLFAFALGGRRGAVLTAAGLVLIAWMGAVRCAQCVQIPDTDVSQLPSTSLTLIGKVDEGITVEDDPHTDEPAFAKFVLNVRYARLESAPIGAPSAGAPVTGQVTVRMTLQSRVTHAALPPSRIPADGDTVELKGRLERPDGPRNPGGFDYRAHLARQGIHATFDVRQPEQTRILSYGGWQNPFIHAARAMRLSVQNACKSALRAPSSGVLAGILIGDRHRISQSVQEEFERTGTTHILATAGLHVGMAVCLLAWLLRQCHVGRRPAAAAAIVALSLYAVMAGERAAVVRAVVVAAYYLFGELVEREPDLPNALAIAVLGLLVANPLDLFDPGFQMSFATVLTIVVLMPLFERVRVRIAGPRRAGTGSARYLRAAAGRFAALAFLAVAAQIGAAPLVALYFYNISLVSVVANALVVPAVFLVIALGFPMIALWSIHPGLAAPLAALLRPILDYILWTVHNCSSVPFASRNVSPPSPLWIAGYYVFVWSLALSLRGRTESSNQTPVPRSQVVIRRVAVVAGFAVLLLAAWAYFAPRPRELRVTFLDVGQGDACVLETPGGKVLIVDTGGLLQQNEDDQGRRIVGPYLRCRGISDIDAMVLTHPHADHAGGATSLIRRFHVGEVMDDGVSDGSPLVPQLLGIAQTNGAKLEVARQGHTLDFGDGVQADILGPSQFLSGQGANNASVVLRVRYGRTSFLLTGDAEAPEEAEILAGKSDLSCDVLKVGHHGSRTSSTPEFLAAAHPRYAVVSVGKRNLYNHPSPEVIDRLRGSGARVFRTDRDGAVICHSDGVSVRLETMLR